MESLPCKHIFFIAIQTNFIRPTFQFYKNNKKLTEMKGANPKQLEAYIQKLSGEQQQQQGESSKKNYGVPGHVRTTKKKKVYTNWCIV